MLKLEDHKPTTLEEAIDLIVNNLDESEITYLEENDAQDLHFTAGMALRSAWLWDRDHPLSQHFRARFGLGHADDTSGIILAGITARVQHKHFQPELLAEHYRQYWAKSGIDPLN